MCEGDLGSHSIRKGSVTYCTSGSTACPGSRYRVLEGGLEDGDYSGHLSPGSGMKEQETCM
eukprot:532328-Hanusia_phi.AAC.1